MKAKTSLVSLLATVVVTPSLTSFVLLGRHKSTLPSTPDAPVIQFFYDPEGEVPSLSKKEEILNGAYANASDKELMPVLLSLAMAQWNEVRGSYLRLSLSAAESHLERSRDDRVNIILAEKNGNASTAAFATPETNPENPDEIFDCDISISLSPVSASSFLETVTHELGHCVGLGHPHNNYGAIMSYSRGGASFRLGPDDKAGVIYLYPDPDYGPTEPKELIGCGNIGSRKKASLWVTLFILILPMIGLYMRRATFTK